MRLPIRPAALVAAAAALVAVVTLMAIPSAARADFRVCNNTATRTSLALAHTDGTAWVSEGWWNLKANACETLLRGALAAQFYYVYGIDESGGEWKGKAFMCTRDREFRIDGRQDCFVRGFDRTGFFEVDTGKNAKDWTVQLTDMAKPGPAQPAASQASPAQPAASQASPAQPATSQASPAQPAASPASPSPADQATPAPVP